MFSELPRDFSRFVSILCCKAVPGVGGTDLAGVLSDKELKGRDCGRGEWGWGVGGGGEVNRLSAALSRSAFESVKESRKRSSSSSFALEASAFCFFI